MDHSAGVGHHEQGPAFQVGFPDKGVDMGNDFLAGALLEQRIAKGTPAQLVAVRRVVDLGLGGEDDRHEGSRLVDKAGEIGWIQPELGGDAACFDICAVPVPSGRETADRRCGGGACPATANPGA